ncbi:hypothetical protein C8R44DRAFT_878570 [Mycena epipterygia]|nr:hypothetical protein C8R44DRAFT_878570 [Mycena epipterygia]
MKECSKSKGTTADNSLPPSIESTQLGVWRLFLEKRTVFDLKSRWESLKAAYPTVKRLTEDFNSLAPILFPLICLCTMFDQVADVILWHLFNRRILFIMQVTLNQRKFDILGIASAVVARLAFLSMQAIISWWCGKMESIVQSRMIRHFEEIVFKWQARADLRTSKDNAEVQDDMTSANVWFAYRRLLIATGRIVVIIWQSCYIVTLVNSNKQAALYVLFLLVKPFMRSFFNQSLWSRAWISESIDPNFNRMQSLSSIVANPDFKQEIISSNITEYLIKGAYPLANR